MVIAPLLLVAACAGTNASEKDQVLERFGALDLVKVAGATEVGRARARGGDSGLTGTPDALVVVLASELQFEDQLKAYQARYGQRYGLHPFGLSTPSQAALLGRLPDDAGTVKVTATTDQPALPTGEPLAASPPRTRSWLVLHLQAA